MVCSNCGKENLNNEKYCRGCGADMMNPQLAPGRKSAVAKNSEARELQPRDPDEMMGAGIGTVIMGDGFLFVGVLLSAIESQAQSLLWLLLLIPAFILFGKGFADVLHAKQLRERLKAANSSDLPAAESPSGLFSGFQNSSPQTIENRASVTDKTTRQLK